MLLLFIVVSVYVVIVGGGNGVVIIVGVGGVIVIVVGWNFVIIISVVVDGSVVNVAFVRQGSMLLNILAITDCSVGIEVLRGKILMHDLSPLFSLHIDNFAPDSFW